MPGDRTKIREPGGATSMRQCHAKTVRNRKLVIGTYMLRDISLVEAVCWEMYNKLLKLLLFGGASHKPTDCTVMPPPNQERSMCLKTVYAKNKLFVIYSYILLALYNLMTTINFKKTIAVLLKVVYVNCLYSKVRHYLFKI